MLLTSLKLPRITVVIATMAARERAEALQRAVGSIRAASVHAVQLVVVVNGSRSDSEVIDWLRSQSDVHLEISVEASLPRAILRGRELVKTEFFTTLDDDDEFMPGAIDIRLAAMNGPNMPDVLVTNGYRCIGGEENLTYASFAQVRTDPLAALFDRAWLQSCNGTYRSASVPASYFLNYHAYAEWTWLAYSLAMDGRKIDAIDIPTYRCHDTPGSLSKSTAYRAAYLDLFAKMLERGPPPHVEKLIQRRVGAALHDQAGQALSAGRWREGLACHARSVLKPGGLRYLGFSRYFVPGWSKP